MKKTTLLLFAVLLSGAANAQSNTLVLLFESQPGELSLLLSGGWPFDPVQLHDANGDGRPDIILQRDDAQGNLQDLRVLDGRTRALIWAVQDVQTTLGFNFSPEIWGFADVNGDGRQEAIFTDQHVLRAYDKRPNDLQTQYTIEGPLQMLGALDLTGDGSEEIIIYLPGTEQVQIWGKP